MPTARTFCGGQGAHCFDRHAGWCSFDGIHVGNFPVRCVVVEDDQFASESGVEGLGHAEGERYGDGGIGGCSALL